MEPNYTTKRMFAKFNEGFNTHNPSSADELMDNFVCQAFQHAGYKGSAVDLNNMLNNSSTKSKSSSKKKN